MHRKLRILKTACDRCIQICPNVFGVFLGFQPPPSFKLTMLFLRNAADSVADTPDGVEIIIFTYRRDKGKPLRKCVKPASAGASFNLLET